MKPRSVIVPYSGKTLEYPMNGVGETKPQMERDISESAYDKSSSCSNELWEAHGNTHSQAQFIIGAIIPCNCNA